METDEGTMQGATCRHCDEPIIRASGGDWLDGGAYAGCAARPDQPHDPSDA